MRIYNGIDTVCSYYTARQIKEICMCKTITGNSQKLLTAYLFAKNNEIF